MTIQHSPPSWAKNPRVLNSTQIKTTQRYAHLNQDTLLSDRIMKSQKFTSIWDAIEDTPQAAASMKARSTLLMALANVIQKRGMTQAEALPIKRTVRTRSALAA